jgi:Mrp family chromosome partitioning ATPase
MVVEHFGPLASSHDGRAESTADLATAFAKAGYSVTVVYVGENNPQFSRVASTYAGQNIDLIT